MVYIIRSDIREWKNIETVSVKCIMTFDELIKNELFLFLIK